MTLPSFDRLYSISDIHLGGDSGFQIFNQGKYYPGNSRGF